MSRLSLLSPLGTTAGEVKPLARRRGNLRGVRVGILDNSKPNAEVLLARVAELLVERAGAGPVTLWRKPGASRPATVIDEVVAGSDVVLTGSAD
ncbi:MAG: hypothetical protein AUG87_11605 [Candidatus Rokubacteria bacterium 13_1_20CM_4_70_14]|nr:MAG: hypothetical protein AUG87_11605 [Candidatus Rokubacteria bacterium 13_1_20CM_4_70_14]